MKYHLWMVINSIMPLSNLIIFGVHLNMYIGDVLPSFRYSASLYIFSPCRKPRWRLGNKQLSQLWKWAEDNRVCSHSNLLVFKDKLFHIPMLYIYSLYVFHMLAISIWKVCWASYSCYYSVLSLTYCSIILNTKTCSNTNLQLYILYVSMNYLLTNNVLC